MFNIIRRWHNRWYNRRYYAQANATDTLHNAWRYVWAKYYSTASGRERGYILPETQEALDILHRLGRESLETSLDLRR